MQFFLNLIYNTSILGANFLVPLVVIPIIGSHYTDNILNEYLLSQVILAFISVFVDWSFSATGAKELSISKNKENALLHISIFRSFIFILAYIISLPVMFYYCDIDDRLTMSIILLSGISVAVNPSFYYQYNDKMKWYAISNLSSKLIFLSLTFLVSESGADFNFIAILFLLSQIIVPLIFLLKALKSIKVKVNFKYIYALGGYYFSFFLASLASSIYRVFPAILIGSQYKGTSDYSAYLIVDRVVRGGNSLVQPVTSTVLPIVLKKGMTKLAVIPYIFVGVALSLIYMFLDKVILSLMMPDKNYLHVYASEIFQLLSVLPLIICASSFVGNQYLLVAGRLSYMSKITFLAAIFFIFSSFFVLLSSESFLPVVYCSILSEIIVLVGFLIGIKKIK